MAQFLPCEAEDRRLGARGREEPATTSKVRTGQTETWLVLAVSLAPEIFCIQ